MVCIQVMGNDASITFAGSQGHYELNVFKPLMAYNFLAIGTIIGDVCLSMNIVQVEIEPNHSRIKQLLDDSLMLVTALNPHIGYENACNC